MAAQCGSEAIEAQLCLILATETFQRSPSLSRFLKYLVEHGLTGEQDGVKEYRLGVDVFERGEDFDPRDDTIVRVQARNLRARIDEYFQHAGPDDTVRFVLAKGGYALQFEPLTIAPPETVREVPKRSRLRWAMLIAAMVIAALVLTAGLGFFLRASRHPSAALATSRATTLLITPFVNMSPDPGNDYLADGLTEELIDALTNVQGLRVLTRSTSLRWKDKELDFANLGELGINHVIKGSVRKEGGKVRIAVHLLDASSGSHLWSNSYDREIQDAIVTEQEIASAVAATLKLRFAPAVKLATAKTPNPEAYDLYLKGRYFWHVSDAASAAKGIEYLARSLTIDPDFAPAYVALAGCYGIQTILYVVPPSEGYARIREMALKALQLDDSLAEAHTLLGGAYAWNDWNWDRSELEYRRAVQLAPQNVIAHQYYASFLGALGRNTEAESEMQRAMRLDSLDTFLEWGEAQLMHWRGDNQQAKATLTRLLKQDPDFAFTPQLLAEVDWSLGKYQDAESVLRGRLVKQPLEAMILGELGYSLAKSGHAEEARGILKQLQERARQEFIPPQAEAFVYLGLGDQDNAMNELRRACDVRSIRPPWLRVDPIYEPLRHHARWPALMRYLNLQDR